MTDALPFNINCFHKYISSNGIIVAQYLKIIL